VNTEHPAPDFAALEQRLIDLEVKASFTDDLVETLDETVARQQQQIELLTRELLRLREQMPEPGLGAARNLRDEIPPHY